MSQANMTLGNVARTLFRANLNDALAALASCQSGTSRPTGIPAGGLWVNTTTATAWVLNLFDGTDDIAIGTVNTTTNVFTPSIANNSLPAAKLALGAPVWNTSGDVGISGALSIPPTKGLVVDGSTNVGASSKYIGGAGGLFGANNSMVFNVPSGMGIEFTINNVTQGSINTSGVFSCKLTQIAAGNGYVILPSGILIQWGTASASTGGVTSNFPIAFPGTCWSIVAVNKNQTNPPAPSVEVVSASQFTLTTSAGTPNCNFIAIGN
jgi:hypothetical protein